MDGGDELRIVLLGKTGVGKSSVGNAILGENMFKAKCSLNSATQNCERAEKVINGRRIVVIDTPGIFDTNRSEEEVKEEIISSLKECAPGPHVFILVLKVDRYTQENQQTVEKLLKYFTGDAVHHMVLLFTHGDDLEQNMTIKDLINHSEKKGNNSGSLKDLAERCGNRVHVLDNKHWNRNEDSSDLDVLSTLQSLNLPEQHIKKITEQMESWRKYRNNQFQITQLMKSIQTILKNNNGQPYRNKTLMEKLFYRDVKRSTIQRVNMVETRRSTDRAKDTVERHNALTHFTEIPEMDGGEELRIVLLGGTAAGISSVGNTILGEKVFNTGCSLQSVTQICQRAEKVINGRRIVVIDTPGIFDPYRSEEEVKYEIISSLVECAPGPHVFILVLPVDRYTLENQRALHKLLQLFSADVVHHMVLLFTHGDDLEENMTIHDHIHRCEVHNQRGNLSLKGLAERFGNRVHVVDNKNWIENSRVSATLASSLQGLNLSEQALRDITQRMSQTPGEQTPWFNVLSDYGVNAAAVGNEEQTHYRNNRFQLTQLMKSIKTILKENKGQHYRNKTLEEIGKSINEEVEKILREIWNERETVDMVEIRRRAIERVRNERRCVIL